VRRRIDDHRHDHDRRADDNPDDDAHDSDHDDDPFDDRRPDLEHGHELGKLHLAEDLRLRGAHLRNAEPQR
jgi:hypothetical protein